MCDARPCGNSPHSPFPVQLIVENRTPFPMARARIRLRYSNTFSHEETSETVFMPVFHGKQRIEREAIAQHCGKLLFSLEEIRCYDFLGLFTCRHRVPKPKELFILPHIAPLELALESSSTPDPESDTFSTEKPGDDPSEIFGVPIGRGIGCAAFIGSFLPAQETLWSRSSAFLFAVPL